MRRATLFLFLLIVFPALAHAQAWRYTGSLHTARRMFSTTLLNNGRVLVAGGLDQSQLALKSCELFDPMTELWTPTAPMSVPRHRHTATTLRDGRVVAIAGNTNDQSTQSIVTTTIEIYDPASGTWSPGGNLLLARQNHTATLLEDGTILVTGGWNRGDVVDECEIYDPATMTAHVIAPLKLRRMDHEAVLMRNGEVMIAGGRIGGWDGAYLTEAEIYNPATGTWRVIDPMFQSRISGFSLVRFSDGTVLAAGGRNAPQSSGPAAEVLDPVAMTWQSVAPMKVPCVWHGGVEMPFDLYMITGGFYDADWRTSTVVTATPTCEWYDKWHGRWYYAPRLNMQRGEHGALYLHDCGNPIFPREIVLVVGGITGNNTITNTAEVLDITEPAREHYMASQEALASVASPSSEDAGNVRLSIVGNGGSSPAVTFTVGTAAAVRVDLVASDGHTVATLADGTYAAGTYRHNVESGTLPSGVYFVRMTSAGLSRVERLVVVG